MNAEQWDKLPAEEKHRMCAEDMRAFDALPARVREWIRLHDLEWFASMVSEEIRIFGEARALKALEAMAADYKRKVPVCAKVSRR